MILGLAGRAGSGKDTAADVLCSAAGFHRMAFADALRREVVEAFGIDPGLFDVPTKELKTEALAIGRCADADFIQLMVRASFDPATPRSPREIMRWWGTEFRRAQAPSYWLLRATETLNDAHRRGYDRIVVTDVRFANEAGFIRQRHGHIWLIRRELADNQPATHPSEHLLPGSYIDDSVCNYSTMTAFAAEVMAALARVDNSQRESS